MKIHAIPILLFVAAAVLTGCGERSATENAPAAPAPVSVKLVQPRRSDVTRSVTLPGNVAANQQVALYAKVGGYLKSIAVDKGDAVKEGALLAEIEVPELLADQAKYKAEVEVADIEFKR